MKKNTGLFLVAFVAAFASFWQSGAHAAPWARWLSATACFTRNLAQAGGPDRAHLAGIQGTEQTYCPVPNDTQMSAREATELKVFAEQGNTGYARACFTPLRKSAYFCGSQGAFSSGGDFAQATIHNPWTNNMAADDLPYVFVDSSTVITVKGLRITRD